ncbi:MAG: erythromycin esterase family protein [Bacteroidota bacterium]
MLKSILQITNLFLILIFISASGLAQENLLVNKLNDVIHPVLTLKPDSSFDDIDFLAETLRGKEIIALGEVTHGTKEIYAYKDRLIRYLVSRLGYKNIAFEADYTGLETLDKYINGQIKEAAMSPNYKPLLEWLKSYNETKSTDNRVHIYGLEMREFKPAIEKVLAANKGLDRADQEILLKILRTPFDKIEKADLDEFRDVCTHLPAALEQKMLIQLIDNYYNFIGRAVKIGGRDAFMADNAIAIKETSNDKKLIIWAHNGHVAKTSLYKQPAMGKFLSQRYGVGYYVIATDINKGNVMVRKFIAKNTPVSDPQPIYFPEVNTSKGYEYYFKQCRYQNFILDVRIAIATEPLRSFLTTPREMRMIGALSSPVNKKLSIAGNFDMVVYFNQSNSL